ncbi:MAG: prephenate dehydrogenase/arogenate dehydrogenase family protein [Clostridiales bacterium]|nr:prephenate dehydrogenase/arogenate dehydrogenase family protein [Clostridiales bacterium]
MNIGIIGLGLIGGSLARSIRANTQHTVLGYDTDKATMLRAKAIDAIHDELTDALLLQCDIVLVALYPEMCADWIIAHADNFGDGAVVIDCAGVKRYVCQRVEPVAAEKNWTYIGGHPMAGREFSGFAYARADLFKNASMILTPNEDADIRTREKIKRFFLEMGFKMVRFCSPAAHDQMIAYTSQLAHVVSGAYVKNPLSGEHKGFSAGSFLDMTRVARLNENMWTELFMENADLLLPALDDIIARLNEYRDVLASGDPEKIRPVLREGRLCKEALDEPIL